MNILIKRNYVIPQTVIVNKGIAGNSSTDIVNRLSTIYSENASLCTLMVGANDFLNSAKLHTYEQYEVNLRTIINGLKNSGSQVLLLTVTPCIESYLRDRHVYPISYNGKSLNNDILSETNNIIRMLSVELNTLYLNTGGLFSNHLEPREDVDSWIRNLSNVSTADGLHPTSAGHNAIGNFIYNFLKKIRSRYDKICCIGDSITYGSNVAPSQAWPSVISALINP